jgi:predicted transglutaminase-like cysteine proteinase
MRWVWVALLMGLIAFTGAPHDAAAFDSETTVHKTPLPPQRGWRATMPVHGLTNAPPGYVDYCRRNPAECRPQSRLRRADGRGVRVDLTSDSWVMLNAVNSYINDQIAPRTDRELYGVEEHWTMPRLAGDCEDYVLLKRRELIRRGWPEGALLITVVLDEQGDGHAVLTVRTAQGDFILDNKHSRVLLWRDVPYTFIKRQSYRAPQLWVSLTPRLGGSAVATSR